MLLTCELLFCCSVHLPLVAFLSSVDCCSEYLDKSQLFSAEPCFSKAGVVLTYPEPEVQTLVVNRSHLSESFLIISY